MTSHPSRVRFPLMACGLIALLTGLWAGLMRLGWELPSVHAALPFVHGPLMVGGFLGTLIGVERAVALGRRWPYIAPLLTSVGALVLVSGFPAAWLMTLGSLGLLGVFGLIVRLQPALATVTMACGALLWCVGNGLWWAGWPLYHVTPWWAGFLVLTIAGERLELSRLLRLSAVSRGLFISTGSLLLVGLMISWVDPDRGSRLFWLGVIGLAVWLLRYDIARRTVRQTGLTRFIAVCLLSGYPWLGVSGLLGLHFGSISAGPAYDAMLHALFLGFVVTMLFGHAPVIFPAVLGRAIHFRSIFYVPLILLHGSLLLRVFGDLAGWAPGRQWGGLINAVALLLFLSTLAHAVWRGAHAPK